MGGGNSERWKGIIGEKAGSLLLCLVEKAMREGCPDRGKIQLLQEHYRGIVPVCVDACASLHKFDLLYGDIYDRFSTGKPLIPYILRLLSLVTNVPTTSCWTFF